MYYDSQKALINIKFIFQFYNPMCFINGSKTKYGQLL